MLERDVDVPVFDSFLGMAVSGTEWLRRKRAIKDSRIAK